MKTSCTAAIAATLLASSVNAFVPSSSTTSSSGKTFSSSLKAVDISDLPGAIDPTGPWDPLGFAEKADIPTMKRYREAEVTHGRVAMLAVLGFFAGEAVAGKSFLFDGQVTGPAITHLSQIPNGFWIVLTIAIGASEQTRATIGWVEPEKLPVDQPGKLRDEYVPGDIGFDPLGLKPTDPSDMWLMQTKELQNGRLAMLAAAGFMAQELVNGKGIIENLQG